MASQNQNDQLVEELRRRLEQAEADRTQLLNQLTAAQQAREQMATVVAANEAARRGPLEPQVGDGSGQVVPEQDPRDIATTSTGVARAVFASAVGSAEPVHVPSLASALSILTSDLAAAIVTAIQTLNVDTHPNRTLNRNPPLNPKLSNAAKLPTPQFKPGGDPELFLFGLQSWLTTYPDAVAHQVFVSAFQGHDEALQWLMHETEVHPELVNQPWSEIRNLFLDRFATKVQSRKLEAMQNLLDGKILMDAQKGVAEYAARFQAVASRTD